MGLRSFFKKAENTIGGAERGAKKFFSKDTGRRLDGTLRKVQNTLPEIASGIKKAGAIAGMLAPGAAAIPVVGAPLSAGLLSASAAAPGLATGLNQASKVSRGIRNEVKKPMIERAKPPPEPESEMFGNMFA